MEKIVDFISKKEQKDFNKFIWKLHKIIKGKKFNTIFESGGRGFFSLKEESKFIADIIFRFNCSVVIRNSQSRDRLARDRITKGEEFYKKLKNMYKIYKENLREGIRYDSIIKELIDSEEIDINEFIQGENKNGR